MGFTRCAIRGWQPTWIGGRPTRMVAHARYLGLLDSWLARHDSALSRVKAPMPALA